MLTKRVERIGGSLRPVIKVVADAPAVEPAAALDAALRELVRRAVRDALGEQIGPHLVPPAQPPTPAPLRYLTPDQAAEIAGVNPETVREWVRAGALPEHRAGRLMRIRLDELEAFLSQEPSESKITDAELHDRAAALIRRRRMVG